MRSPRLFVLVAVTLLLGNLSLAREEEKNVKNFGKTSQGIGELDRAAGVYLGPLSIPAEFVPYTPYVSVPDGGKLGGEASYTSIIDPQGMMRDERGYGSITVYNMEDFCLIPMNRYSITSYTADANSDGTFTVRINPEGKDMNAIPTVKKPIYAVMRVYPPQCPASDIERLFRSLRGPAPNVRPRGKRVQERPVIPAAGTPADNARCGSGGENLCMSSAHPSTKRGMEC